LGALLSEKFGADVELIEGDNGIFDVHADGGQIFSKHEQGRFPEDEEICAALRERE
jgi:selT/selW/selH-like putative selenoprotein